MENNPLLSVIVPIYNVEAYLERCIKSIQKQSYENLEIILVDDGSKDNCALICDTYKSKDSRIKVIHKENGGLVSARKAGITVATGKYVTYVDSDDWIEPIMYEKLITAAISGNADVVTTGCIRDYGNHQVIENDTICEGIYYGKKLYEEFLPYIIDINCFYRSNISAHIWCKLFRRELALKYQLQVHNAINVFEDAAFTYPCLLNSKRVVVLKGNYYHYCIRKNSIMGENRSDESFRFKVLFSYMEKEFSKKIKKISNITQQYTFFKYYALFMRQADKIIKWKGNLLFPYKNIYKKEKIIIYGTGRFGLEFKDILLKCGDCEIVACMDRTGGEGIITLEELHTIDYDKIIIAVLLYDILTEIEQELLLRGVPEDKIVKIDTELLKEAEI